VPRQGSSVHLCQSCEERGVITHVRRGQALCAHCRAEQRAHVPELGDPGVSLHEAKQVLEMRTQENRLIQAGVVSILGALAAGGLAIWCLMESLRYSHRYDTFERYWSVVPLGALAGAVIGWGIGYTRPLWKAGL
jgi:hypothetical protein